MTNAARTIILYGDSGLGKTANAVEFALLQYQQSGLPVAVISYEMSSRAHFEPLEQAGIVKYFTLNGVANPLPALRKFSMGMWLTYKDFKWTWKAEKFGAYVIEGLRSISECLLADVAQKGRQIGQDVVGKFEEDGEKFAKAAPSHYGFVQDEVLRLLNAFGGIGVPVLWTGHEVKAEDTDKQPIRGPGIAGKARTEDVQKYCNILLHIECYPETVQQKDAPPRMELKRRIWFTKHPDPLFKTLMYPAKVTLATDQLNALHQAYPGGFFEPTVRPGPGGGLMNSLADFLRLEQSLVSNETDRLREWKAQVDAAHV